MSSCHACTSCCELRAGGKTRRYYLVANRITWDYLPLGINACQERILSPEESLYARGGNSSAYIKAQFQAFSDATFSKKLVSMHFRLLGCLFVTASSPTVSSLFLRMHTLQYCTWSGNAPAVCHRRPGQQRKSTWATW
jgi:hypothetical protein